MPEVLQATNMKITNVRLTVLETSQPRRVFDLVRVPGTQRDRWKHYSVQRSRLSPYNTGASRAGRAGKGARQRAAAAPSESAGPLRREFMLHVETDQGIEGVCTAVGEGMSRLIGDDVEQLRKLVIGHDPLDREFLYQKLHQGARWVYREPGWFGAFDNCLWDIAGKAANLPVYALLGRARERVPCYLNILGESKEEAADDAVRAVSEGFTAAKDHFYHRAAKNIEWLSYVREKAGPDVDLMHDPVGVYTFEEALRVGRALEELAYRWFEEPLPERQHNKLKQLCETLDIPVLATEMMMYDIDLCAQWLISGATDLIRANARHGTTMAMKLAHLAELHGTNIEFNGAGGLYGLVHAHILCSVHNTSYYEYFAGGMQDEYGRELGMTNPVLPEKGHIRPPDAPGWGAVWDWKQFRKRTVEVY
jgi:L-alanine-DL-glutamate epimerase-like enolase superfamily enzyme